jgi:hypothetical protein
MEIVLIVFLFDAETKIAMASMDRADLLHRVASRHHHPALSRDGMIERVSGGGGALNRLLMSAAMSALNESLGDARRGRSESRLLQLFILKACTSSYFISSKPSNRPITATLAAFPSLQRISSVL